RTRYRHADGITACAILQEDPADADVPNTFYYEQERRMLDSIDRAMKGRYGGTQAAGFPDATDPARKTGAADPHEKALQDALAAMNSPTRKEPSAQEQPAQQDPMALFRQQMELLDSMGRANDPEYRAEQEKLRQAELLAKRQQERQDSKLEVTKASGPAAVFNTVTPD